MLSDCNTSLFERMHLVKVAQTITSALVLTLCLYDINIMDYGGLVVANGTALFTFAILGYYVVAIRTPPDIYRLMAILAGELVGIVAWLATCFSLAAVYAVLLQYDAADYPDLVDYGWSYDDGGCHGNYFCHEMLEFMIRDSAETFGPVLGAAIAASGIQLVLFCVSLGFMAVAIYRHCEATQSVKLEDDFGESRRIEKKE